MRQWIVFSVLLLSTLYIPAALNEIEAQTGGVITVAGRVERGTVDGAPLPANMLLQLRVIDSANASRSSAFSTVAQPDGSFVFENVPRVSGSDFYLISTEYAGFVQTTRPILPGEADFVVFLVYETTTSTDGLEIVNGYIQIDEFVGIDNFGNNLSVAMALNIVNRGDRIVYDPENRTSFTMQLPVGAYGIDEVILATEDRAQVQRLMIDDSITPSISETTALIPGWPEHRLEVVYLVPYPGSAVIDQGFSMRVSELDLLVPEDVVFIDSEQFTATDESRVLSDERPPYAVYTLNDVLTADTALLFTMQGEPPQSDVAGSGDADESSSLQQTVLIVGVVLFLLFLMVVWWVIRSRQVALNDMLEQERAQ